MLHLNRGRLLCLTSSLLLTTIGCGHKSSANSDQTAARINITPSTLDLTQGSVGSISSSVVNASGSALTKQPTITYTSSDPSAVTVTSSGSVCAGVWDISAVVCRNGTIPSSPVTITASGDNVSASITVTVHVKLDRIILSATAGLCISQNSSLQFTATAYRNGVDVTDEVNSFTWKMLDGSIGQISNNGLVVARTPGISNVVASASNVISAPLAFVACPVASIQLAAKDTGKTSFAFHKGDSSTLQTTVVDTQGNPINGLSLTFTSSQPTVVRATASNVVNASIAALSAGASTVMASCTPTQCNNAPRGIITTPSGETTAQALGFGYPIYSNLVTATVAGSTTTAIYVAGDQYPDGHSNHQLRIYDSITLTEEKSITLPYVPNSLLFTKDGTKAFIGSSDGTDGNAIMTLDPSSNAITVFSGTVTGDPTIDKVTGKILAVAPDGSKVIVSNPEINRVFVVNVSGGTAQVFVASGIRSATFSPDSFKAFLAGDGGAYDYVTYLHPLTSSDTSAGSVVAYLPQGTAAYISGNKLDAYSTCTSQAVDQQSLPIAALVSLFPASGLSLLGVNDTSWIAFTTNPAQNSCPASVTSTVAATVSAGTCPITHLTPVLDGSKVFATGVSTSCGSANAIPEYDVGKASATALPLSSGGIPVAGDVTADGSQLYVGVLNGSSATLHYIDVSSGSDRLAIDIPFVPNIISVLPK